MASGNVYANGEHPDASQNGTKSDNRNISSSYNQWIDLFGWATSGYHNISDSYNTKYMPYEIGDSRQNSPTFYYNDGTHGAHIVSHTNEFGYGPTMTASDITSDLVGAHSNYDWGVYNNISNDGSYGAGSWRTMTGTRNDNTSIGEWEYLFKNRSASTLNGTSNARFALAQINVRNNQTVNGIILFPDTYTWPQEVAYYPETFNYGLASFENGHQWTEAEWSLLEKNGGVFLPAAGYRPKSSELISLPGWACLYHTTTRGAVTWDGTGYNNTGMNAGKTVIGSGQYEFSTATLHYEGVSVRLVRNVN